MDHDIVNEIRSKVDIVEVIASYIPLTQKGKNYFGVCPFHDDTNPSMSVSKEKQIYRCFSCGASGNVFNFVMDYEHISFKEALALLGNKVGIELQGYKGPKEEKNQELYDIYNIANKYYQNNLNTPLGKSAKEYLTKRQINEDIIKEFEIGLSLNKQDDLTKILTQKKYPINTLNNIGLSNFEHDIYVNRIMFPLHDINGRVVGFSGRIYNTTSKENKYVNTKGTEIFQKGNTLYNYHRAKEIIRTKKQVIVMEGFMAAIRASSIGVKNVVSLMGTAMTKEQAELIKRLSSNIILCFDGDEAGKKATMANGSYFEKIGIVPKVIELNEGLDPDDYIIKYGEEKFKSLISSAINFNDYKMKALREGVNLNSEEETVNYINTVLNETSKIDDEIHREIILKNLAIEFNIGYNTLEKRLKELREKNNISKPKEVNIEVKQLHKKDKYYISILACLYYMLVNNDVMKYYEKEGILFPDEKYRHLASEISYFYKKYGIINLADFYTYLSDKKELLTLLNEIVALDLDDQVEYEDVLDYVKMVKEYNVNQEIKRLQKMIKMENDPLEKAKIAERVRMLRIGS